MYSNVIKSILISHNLPIQCTFLGRIVVLSGITGLNESYPRFINDC